MSVDPHEVSRNALTGELQTRPKAAWSAREPDYDAARIRELRESLRLSQSILAAVLDTSVSTVRKWEIGDKKPSGPSSKLLDLIERKGLEAVL